MGMIWNKIFKSKKSAARFQSVLRKGRNVGEYLIGKKKIRLGKKGPFKIIGKRNRKRYKV